VETHLKNVFAKEVVIFPMKSRRNSSQRKNIRKPIPMNGNVKIVNIQTQHHFLSANVSVFLIKVCKSSSKSTIQQQSTANSKDLNVNSLIPKKTLDEKSRLVENIINKNNTPTASTKETISTISQNNKCICYVIDNDSLYTNNICRLCKRVRTEKFSKPQPKKIMPSSNELKSSKEYQSNPNTTQTPSKVQITKSNSKETIGLNELKRLEVKKNQFETVVDGRNSKALNNLQKPNPNMKPSINNSNNTTDINGNPFKKTFINNPQINNSSNTSTINSGVNSYKRNSSKENDVRSFNSNYKSTVSKQRYNEYSSQKLK
jgi:hypothetical protein